MKRLGIGEPVVDVRVMKPMLSRNGSIFVDSGFMMLLFPDGVASPISAKIRVNTRAGFLPRESAE